MTTPKKKGISITDLIGIVISVIALVFSGITYYYSNLYVKDEMMARFVEIPQLKENAEKIYDANLRVIFMNTGNKAGVVLSVGYRLGKDLDGTGFGGEFDTDSIPFILKPDQIKFINIPIPGKYLADNFASGDTVLTSDSPHIWSSRFYLTVNINSLNSKGEEFKAVSEPVAVSVVSRASGIIEISPAGGKERQTAITTELYHNGQPNNGK